MMGTNASEQSPAPAAIGEREIVVSTGDTLWGIASQVSNPSDDIRFVVYLIKDRNNLSNTNLTPGQKLIIPTI
jgi:LysM repeat protein